MAAFSFGTMFVIMGQLFLTWLGIIWLVLAIVSVILIMTVVKRGMKKKGENYSMWIPMLISFSPIILGIIFSQVFPFISAYNNFLIVYGSESAPVLLLVAWIGLGILGLAINLVFYTYLRLTVNWTKI